MVLIQINQKEERILNRIRYGFNPYQDRILIQTKIWF